MKSQNHLETVRETESFEETINMSKDLDKLKELESREQNFFQFKQLGNIEYFENCMANLHGKNNQELV